MSETDGSEIEWAVGWDDRVYQYPSEEEARRQLNWAQMDVPVYLISRKVGPWEVTE